MTTADSNPELVELARALAARAGFDGADIQPLDRGLSADLFTVRPRAESDPVAVVKLQRGHRGKAYAESAALDLLDDADLSPSPRVLHAEPTHAPPALVLSWLSGATHTLEQAKNRPDEDLAVQLGRWLAQFHETQVAGDRVKMSTDPLSLTERLRTQARNAVDSAGANHAHATLLADARRWLDDALDRHPNLGQPRRMTHRDLRPDNVVLDRAGGFVGVVDFEHAAAADPAWDFAKLQWWCFDRIDGLEAPFVDAYSAIRPVPDAGTRKLFHVFEATTLLAYFTGKQNTYEREARRQLEAELTGAQRPEWCGDW